MTSDFDPVGREKWVAKMRQAGYQELESMKGFESYNNFCCLNCVYFDKREDSPTGWWCKEWGFPDARFGCCNSFKVLPK